MGRVDAYAIMIGKLTPRLITYAWMLSVCLASVVGCVLVGTGRASSIAMAVLVGCTTLPVAAPWLVRRIASGDPLYLYFPIMLVAVTLRVIWDTGVAGLQFAAALVLICSILLSGFAGRLLARKRNVLLLLAILACAILIIGWYASFPGLRQKNAVGGAVFYLLLLSGIVFLRDRFWLSAYLLSSAAVVVAIFDMRSIVIVCAIIVFAMYHPLGKSPRILFLAVVVMILGTIIVVSVMQTGAFDKYLQAYNSHFQRGLESGRDVIWPMVLDQASAAPYFGLGFDAGKFSFRDEEMSAHNQYLEILVQQGGVGVLLVALLLTIIANKASVSIRDDFCRQRFSGVFCGIVYANNFEVQLFQNLFYIGLVQWLLIALTLYGEMPRTLGTRASSGGNSGA